MKSLQGLKEYVSLWSPFIGTQEKVLSSSGERLCLYSREIKMGIIGTLLIILFVIVSVLLILFVLLQDDQGEGLGGLFGGSSASPFGGATNNALVRLTTILGTIFMVSSLLVALVVKSPNSSDVVSEARKLNAENGSGDWWDEDVQEGNGEGDALVIPE